MKKFVKNSIRFSFVIVGVTILTSFSIDATDTLRGSQTALSIFSKKLTADKCPSGMLKMEGVEYNFCVDIYEVSAGVDCTFLAPNSVLDTTLNIADAKCLPASESGKQPWTYVAKPQAEQICAKVGKRLLSADEWFAASLGTPDSVKNCNLNNTLKLTGESDLCRSGVGAYDMVGNVWELIDAKTSSGTYAGRSLPEEGYVSKIDEAGIATETSDQPNPIYNDDYFWSKPDGNYTLLRGGFYGSRTDGGIYTTHAQTDVNFASAAIGFRCAKTLQ